MLSLPPLVKNRCPNPWGNHRRGYHGTFSIRRTDYGINYDTNVLSDEVDVTLAFETTHKK